MQPIVACVTGPTHRIRISFGCAPCDVVVITQPIPACTAMSREPNSSLFRYKFSRRESSVVAKYRHVSHGSIVLVLPYQSRSVDQNDSSHIELHFGVVWETSQSFNLNDDVENKTKRKSAP